MTTVLKIQEVHPLQVKHHVYKSCTHHKSNKKRSLYKKFTLGSARALHLQQFHSMTIVPKIRELHPLQVKHHSYKSCAHRKSNKKRSLYKKITTGEAQAPHLQQFHSMTTTPEIQELHPLQVKQQKYKIRHPLQV